MKTKLFIDELSKEIKENLTVVDNKNYPSMASIYWNNQQICSVPSDEIFEEHNPSYANELGYAHKNIATAKAQVINFIDKWNNEEGFKELMTEAI